MGCAGGGGAWNEAEHSLNSKNYTQAQTQYAALFEQAVERGDCTGALTALTGLRESAYYLQDPARLRTLKPSLRQLWNSGSPCRAPCTSQFAFGLNLCGEPGEGDNLISEAAGWGPDLRRLQVLWREQLQYSVSGMPPGADSPQHPAWKNADENSIESRDQVVLGGQSWEGPADASAKVQIGQLRGAFYVRIRVTDDSVGPGDEVILALDADLSSGSMLRRKIDGGNVHLFRIPAGTESAVFSGFRAWRKCETDSSGYVALAGFPPNSIPGLAVEPDRRYSFDVMILDSDPSGETVLRLSGMTPDVEDMYLCGVLAFGDY